MATLFYTYNLPTLTATVINNASYTSYTSVVIPSTVNYNSNTYNVTSIGNDAFFGCSSLTSITISNSVTSIENSTFAYCTGLTSITIPNSVTSIGTNAFYSCTSLTTITIPNSVTRISDRMFYMCNSLTSITIPNSVTSIGVQTFRGCTSLLSVTFNQTQKLPTIGSDAFYTAGNTAYYQVNVVGPNGENPATYLKSNGFTNAEVIFTCFLEDSKILTNKGYIPIQDLRKGDLVKTLKHDYKAIDMIGKRTIYHPALKDRIKDQLYKCSKDNFNEIFEPLIITGCHSILVENSKASIDEKQIEKVKEINGGIYLTDDKLRIPACVDLRTSVYETPGTYTIYHLALENNNYVMNYGIYANGLLVETCSQRYLKELSNMTLIE